MKEEEEPKKPNLKLLSLNLKTSSMKSLLAQRRTKEKGIMERKKIKCSYCGKGFHPEHACMKKKLDEATSLLKRNHINLPEIFRRRD